MKDYKKILEGVVYIINTAEKSDIGFANICAYIGENCPELKESLDERMIQYFNDLAPFDKAEELYEKYGFSHKDAIAWLEKQGEKGRELKFVTDDAYQRGYDEGLKVTLEKQSERYNDIFYGCVGQPTCQSDCFLQQDEQKPTDKVEPKFKVGDSISKKHNSDINKFGVFTITSIADNKYWYNDSVVCDFSDQDLWELVERPKFKKGDWVFHNTAEFVYMIQTIGRDGYGVISREGKKSVVYYSAEINYRLWTIQDAKDGDILATLDYILIFKEHLSKDGGVSHCHYDFGAGNPQFVWLEDKNWYFGKEAKVYPATKEQRDLLFQKMKEAGYEWDANKKELKKIEKMLFWSEDDLNLLNRLIGVLDGTNKEDYHEAWEETFLPWLKSLRPHRWKPSLSQLNALSVVAKGNAPDDIEEINSLYNDLKKLREE